MTTSTTSSPDVSELNGEADQASRLWGLDEQQLHDAFWLSRGVQCVRQGQPEPLDVAADLFLLLEPQQMVLFNLDEIMNRLIWQGAAVTRLRLTNHSGTSYRERIVTDERGMVERVERTYTPTSNGSHRVFLTARSRLAERWRMADSPRTGWNQIRRTVAWSRIDRQRIAGTWFTKDDHNTQGAMIDQLLETWKDPDRVIQGIKQIREGVWALANDPAIPEDVTLVGPAWIGAGRLRDVDDEYIIGPTWRGDSPRASAAIASKASVRELVDVEAAETRAQATHSQVPLYPIVKRLFDITFSAAMLVVLSPLLGLIALAIYFDTGRPILFGHRRQSRGGRPFNCLKFRTMKRDAEKMVPDLSDHNLCDGPQVFIKNDPRVTRVGHLLRRFQLDELPQFWNVLCGDMSIVGPRPSPDRENQFCPAWRELRLSVRPGITGLWQLQRTRSPGEDFQEWIRYDIEYVRRANLWLDTTILVRTLGLLLFKRNSYDAK